MRARTYFRYLIRESRGARGRLAFFIACLAVGVAAVVSVAGLTRGLEEAVRREARALLAADLTVRGRQPLPVELRQLLDARAELTTTRIKEMVTVLAVVDDAGEPRASQLVELLAIDGAYPFYGELELQPAAPLDRLLAGDGAVVAPDLLARLGVEVGEELVLGGHSVRIAGIIRAEPGFVADAFRLGPRVIVSEATLARTDLERFGSTIVYRTLVRLADSDREGVDALAEELRAQAPEAARLSVETYTDAQPAFRDGLSRVDRYVGLVALLSLILGGVGVAQSTRAWIAGRVDAMAVLSTLGMRPREIFTLYFAQAAALGLVGGALGVAAGMGLQLLVPRLLADLIPAGLETGFWQPAAAARGMALGVGVALVFSLSPLSAVLRVPPLRALRSDVEPLAPSRWTRWGTAVVLAAGIWIAAATQARSLATGGAFVAALALAASLLALATLGLVRLLARLPRLSAGVAVRHGLAALARPGAGTVGAAVALGLGILVLVGMALVERGLTRELQPRFGEDAPTVFMIDIQPQQWAGVRELLAQSGASDVDSVPVVTARLQEIGGTSVTELAAAADGEGRRWALTREQRLTYVEELPADNEVIAGELWSDPEHFEVSLERDFARDLGVGVGDRLTFDVQGVPVELAATSIREVDWGTFGINFFLVAEPGSLDEAPQFRVATARLDESGEQRLQTALATAFPNVTLFRTRQILDKVRAVLERLATAVRLLGAFTLVVGVAILAGAVSADSIERGREIALYKTLGMTRYGVAAMFAIEFALLGLVSGIVGTGGGTLLAATVLARGMDVAFRLEPLALAAAVAASIALTVLTGLVAATGALRRRPVEVLRAG